MSRKANKVLPAIADKFKKIQLPMFLFVYLAIPAMVRAQTNENKVQGKDNDFNVARKSIGVQKIPEAVKENVLGILSFIFTGIEQNHADSSLQIRFFNSSQFHKSFDSVVWF